MSGSVDGGTDLVQLFGGSASSPERLVFDRHTGGNNLSAFQAGYVIAVLTPGFPSDRMGGRKVFIINAIEARLAGLSFAIFARGFFSAAVLRVLAGRRRVAGGKKRVTD